jgi:hypothetical protein
MAPDAMLPVPDAMVPDVMLPVPGVQVPDATLLVQDAQALDVTPAAPDDLAPEPGALPAALVYSLLVPDVLPPEPGDLAAAPDDSPQARAASPPAVLGDCLPALPAKAASLPVDPGGCPRVHPASAALLPAVPDDCLPVFPDAWLLAHPVESLPVSLAASSLADLGDLLPVHPDDSLPAFPGDWRLVLPDHPDDLLPVLPVHLDDLQELQAALPLAQTLAEPGSCPRSDASTLPWPDGPCSRSPSSGGSAQPAAERQSAMATGRDAVRAVPPSRAEKRDSSTRRGRRCRRPGCC